MIINISCFFFIPVSPNYKDLMDIQWKQIPFHKMCPANCKRYAGQDPRCPCSKYPLHPSCPPNCERYAGKDKRCPCSEFPLHKNCPPNCDLYTGKEFFKWSIRNQQNGVFLQWFWTKQGFFTKNVFLLLDLG